MSKRKICVVTGSRAEYGLLYWLLKEIESDKKLELQLIVTGMHLSPKFGLTYREIERILGVSHVSVLNWVKKYNIKRPYNTSYHPTYKILNALELANYFSTAENIKGAGVIVTELGDKFMLIKWERFKD